MGLNPFVALLIAVGVVLLLKETARRSYLKIIEEVQKEGPESSSPENSGKIIKNKDSGNSATEHVVQKPSNQNTKKTEGKSRKELIVKISFGGMLFINIYIITKLLSTGLTDSECMWLMGLFLLCWMCNKWALNLPYNRG